MHLPLYLSQFFNGIKYHKDRVKAKITLFMLILIIYTLIFTYYCKDEEFYIEKPSGKKYVDMFQYTISTFTTLGTGDILPLSLRTRYLTFSLLIVSFVIAIL